LSKQAGLVILEVRIAATPTPIGLRLPLQPERQYQGTDRIGDQRVLSDYQAEIGQMRRHIGEIHAIGKQ
tara:strand:+ start:534 stop:740 length:207 start_codon:yes stop_codon:yes gene_type:complete